MGLLQVDRIEWRLLCFAVNDFGGIEADNFTAQQFIAIEFAQAESAGADFEGCQPPTRWPSIDTAQQVFKAILQQCFVGQGAGRHHAYDLALDRTLAGGGIADLLTNGDGFAFSDQFAEVAIDGVIRYAAHRYRLATGLAAPGQRYIQQTRGLACILVKQLIEIAHAVKQQCFGMISLDAQVLLHHWCVRFKPGIELIHMGIICAQPVYAASVAALIVRKLR